MNALFSINTKRNEEKIIKNYSSLVKEIAYHLHGSLPQRVSLDDLIQAGMLGLLETIRRYDESKGASFETYARIRIRGHMLDEVRNTDWVPRSVYRNIREVSKAIKRLQNRFDRKAKSIEIANELNISLEKYYNIIQDYHLTTVFGFGDLDMMEDDLYIEEKSILNEPYAKICQKDLLNHIKFVVDGLSFKKKMIWNLYYEQDLNLKEIGNICELTESGILYILNQIKLKVQLYLKYN